MAELTTTERLQPALLDRLTDDEPKEKLESRDRRVMSMRQLRAAVLRDLSWLLNAPCRPAGDEIYDYPAVARSVLNFGMPDLTGLTASTARSARLAGQVQDAILTFEPRIVGDSLHVRMVDSSDAMMHKNTYSFEISGEVCPLPMPEALFVRTEVDLETGRCEVRDRP
jgi:type VI secretion system protein ImpF